MAEEHEPIFLAIARLAKARGATPIKDKVWEVKLDSNWWFAVNGFSVEKTVRGDSGVEQRVPAFHTFVEFNGWPAGIFNAFGGSFAAGYAANEESFCAAIRKATESWGQGRRTRE